MDEEDSNKKYSFSYLRGNYKKLREKQSYMKKIIAYSGIGFGSLGLLIVFTPIKWALIGGLGAILFPEACNKGKTQEKNIERKVEQPEQQKQTNNYNLFDSR